MARVDRARMRGDSVSRKDTRGTGVVMETWDCDEKGCTFKFGPINAAKANILRKAHLKTHGRKS